LIGRDLGEMRFEDIEAKTGLRILICGLLADLNDSGATFEQIALCIENGL
jgi:hypothetical protein